MFTGYATDAREYGNGEINMPDRNKIISLRLTRDEYKILEELAEADMRPLSSYIRVLVMESVPDERRRLKIKPKD